MDYYDLYPFGWVDCHFQADSIISLSPNSACQLSSLLASDVSAVHSAMSPGLLGPMTVLIFLPDMRRKVSMICLTEYPVPVPTLKM